MDWSMSSMSANTTPWFPGRASRPLPGARTGLYVPEWNKLVVAAPRQGTDEARLLVFAVEQ